MIPTVKYPLDAAGKWVPDANGLRFSLRGIVVTDKIDLFAIMIDRADDGTGPYSEDMAGVHCYWWEKWNADFTGLPAETPQTLSWMLDVYGLKDDDGYDLGRQTVGMCRIGYWGTTCVVLYQAVRPAYRQNGFFTTMNSMLRTLIKPMGVTDIRFQSLESAVAVDKHATDKLGLTPTETGEIGLTGQALTSYEFTADYQAERLKDPKNAAEVIDARIDAVPTKGTTPVDDQPVDPVSDTPDDSPRPADPATPEIPTKG